MSQQKDLAQKVHGYLMEYRVVFVALKLDLLYKEEDIFFDVFQDHFMHHMLRQDLNSSRYVDLMQMRSRRIRRLEDAQMQNLRRDAPERYERIIQRAARNLFMEAVNRNFSMELVDFWSNFSPPTKEQQQRVQQPINDLVTSSFKAIFDVPDDEFYKAVVTNALETLFSDHIQELREVIDKSAQGFKQQLFSLL